MRPIRLGFVFSLALAAMLGATTLAGAHSDLLAASPGPGERVGGTIERIQLVYSGPLIELDVEVVDPDGDELTGRLDVLGSVAEIMLGSPLTEEGQYTVRHSSLSPDGDRVEAAYLFSYEEGAPEPLPVVASEVEEARPLLPRLAIAAAVIVVTALVVNFVRLRRRVAAHTGR